MGNQDSDLYDPKPYRNVPIDVDEYSSPRYRTYLVDDDESSRKINWWLTVVTWGAAFTAMYFAISAYVQKQVSQPKQLPIVHASPLKAIDCVSADLPTNASVRIMESSIMKRSDVPYSGIVFKNNHSTAITASILQDERKVASVIAWAGEVAELSAPVGHYALQIAWGTKWCGQERDFEDQRVVNVNGGIVSQHGQTTSLLLESDPVLESELRLTWITSQPPSALPTQPTFQGSHGELEVRADRLGHFRIPGKVNNRPVTFLVDTGASTVVISRKMANEAGIYNCEFDGSGATANGRVEVCSAKGVTIEFGGFVVPNIKLSIVPNMDDEVLLGMSVLKHMQLQQGNGVLRLTAK
jgi:clan AA aspartic protease (TIGR02281 family)